MCRNTEIAQVLCTLLFEDGAWEAAPTSARTAKLRLVKGGRAFAKGTALLQSGRVRNTRTVHPGSYRLKITVAGTTRTFKVKVGAGASGILTT